MPLADRPTTESTARVRVTRRRGRVFAALLVLAVAAWAVVFLRPEALAQRHVEAGISAARRMRAGQAEAEWRAALALDPRSADAWYLLGEIYLSTRNWPLGADAFQHLLRVSPATPHAHGDLATCLYQGGDRMGGYAEAKQELERDPNHIASLVICARMSAMLSQDRQEGDCLRRLSVLLPQSAPPQRLYAEYLINNSRYAEAAPILQQLVALSPSEPQAYSLRGISGFNTDPSPNGLSQAEADLRQAIRLDPRIPLPYLYLGKLYRREGHAAQAIPPLETAHRLTPAQIAISFELAQSYEQAGEVAKAARMRALCTRLQQEDSLKNSLVKRCMVDRNNFHNYLQAGLLILKAGDYHEALYYLSRARMLHPQDVRVLAGLQKLAVAMRRAPPESDIASMLLAQQTSSPERP